MVGRRQQGREILERRRFTPGVEFAPAPQRYDDSRRFVAPPRFEIGAGERELAGGGRGRIGGKAGRNDTRRRVIGVEMGLRDRAQPVFARPMRVGGRESGKALVVGVRRKAQRQPVESGPFSRIVDLGGERVAPGKIALAIERGGGGERRAVETRRRSRGERNWLRRDGVGDNELAAEGAATELAAAARASEAEPAAPARRRRLEADGGGPAAASVALVRQFRLDRPDGRKIEPVRRRREGVRRHHQWGGKTTRGRAAGAAG